jgi:TB2/DP1, HVA22 family
MEGPCRTLHSINHHAKNSSSSSSKHHNGFTESAQQENKLVTLRGGDGGDATTTIMERTALEITPAKVVAYTGATLLAVLTVGLVRKITRSGGHGPLWLTKILPEPYATGALHLGYLLHCLVVLKLIPVGLRDVVFSPTGVVLLGTLFPVVESIRAAASSTSAADSSTTTTTVLLGGGNNNDPQRTWLQYWIMHGLFSYSTEFIDKLADKYPFVHRHWFAFQFYLFLWLLLPMTDGAMVLYNLITKPYLVPIFKPINKMCEGWLTTLALTLVNASYMWWFSVIFLALPNIIKRLAVMFTGTVFPIIATVMAVATLSTTNQDDIGIGGGDGMKWLTYWSCFSLLHLAMTTIEKLVRIH